MTSPPNIGTYNVAILKKENDMILSSLLENCHLPLCKAASLAGVGISTAKLLCRRRGIYRWPHRKIVALQHYTQLSQDLSRKLPKDMLAVKQMYRSKYDTNALKRLESQWHRVKTIQKVCKKKKPQRQLHWGITRPRTWKCKRREVDFELARWWVEGLHFNANDSLFFLDDLC